MPFVQRPELHVVDPSLDPDPDYMPEPPGNETQPQGSGGSRPAPSFVLVPAAELWAPLPEPRYVIDRIIRRASVVELVAYGGSAKTWMAVDAVVSVGAGLPWLGRFAVEQGPAVYLDYENGAYELRRRLQAVAMARGLEGPIANVCAAVMPSLYMSDARFEAAVTEAAKDRALVVIDTLRAAAVGLDENDSNIRLGIDGLRRAAEATGCSFLLLVHSKKTSGGKTEIDPREAGRGSSAIYDAADAVLHVRYVPGEPQHVSQTKARTGRYVEPFDVVVRDANGGVLVEASDPEQRGAGAGTEAQMLRVVAANPGEYNRGKLCDAVSGERRQLKLERVKGLVESGRLLERGGRLYPAEPDEYGEDFDDDLS